MVPTASINVVIPSGAVRMPSLISSASCNSIIINAGAVVTNTSAGILNIAGTFSNNGTYTDNGTTVFNGSTGQQTFSGITTFNNLTLNNSTSLLLPAAITINGNLLITAGTLIANDFNISVKGNWTNNVASGAFTAGTGSVTFNGNSAQAIGGTASTTFNNCTATNTGSTVTLNVNSIISGNLSVSGGTFDLGSFTANRATAGGILTVSNNAFLKIGGTNSYPSNYTANTLAAASTVEYSGTAQTVAAQLYGNLKLSSASGAVVKTFPSVALTIAGNLVSITGPGSGVSFTAAADISINGDVLIGASTTFNGGSYTHSIGGNWDNSGTYNGNTGTITLNGPGTTAGGSGTQNFNNLMVAASLISFTNSSISISGNLATTVPGSFSQASGGTFTMTGAGKTISGSGIAVDNLTISGSVSTSPSFAIAGNLTVSGSFTSTAGTITMSGAAKTISGPGTSSIYILSVTGSITTAVDFTITAGLIVNGSLAASAGTTTFAGTAAFSGTAGLFNVVINGTQLQLSANSILGIANTFTITAGTLDVTSFVPNTVNFNGTGAQIINAINYNNLTLSNGGSKTAAANITINNNITIQSGTSVTVSGGTLKIAGAINNAGTFDVSAGTIEMNGASSQVIPAGVFDGNSIRNLIISNDVTLQGALSVSNTLSFGSSNNILSTGDFLTLKSDAGGTARLADITNGGTESGNAVSGKVTIERYIPGRKSWRLLSVPVTAAGAPSINEAWQEAVVSGNPSPGYGTQITGGTNANGFDLGVNTNPSILVYSNGSNSLPGLPNVPGTYAPITDYPGYFLFVRGNRSTNLSLGANAPVSNTTLRIKGNLNTDDINMNVNAQNSTLAGNPYPSAIDFHSLTKNNVKDKVYIWDPKMAGTRGVGGYVTLIWNGSSYDATSSVSPVSRYIPSGEAFFVESSDGTNPGILTFKEADKTSSGSDNLFRPVYNSEKLRIDLLAVDAAGAASLSDGTLTAYGDNYSNKVDANDASKYSNIGENISILRENNKLSVERRHTIEGPDTTFLNIYNLNKQTYQLQVTTEGMGNAGLYAVLKDKYSSAINNTPLTMGGVSNISFTINSDAASYNRNRFSVVFAKQSVLPVSFTSVQARQQQNDIVVSWNTATETNVKNYEVQTSSNGNKYTGISTVTTIGNNGGNAAYSFVDSNASVGFHYYRIRSTSFSGRENYSQMVKVNMVKTGGEITVYPNPVTNGQIKLQLNNMPTGQYHIRILDMLGQVKMSEVFNHNGGSAAKKMQLATDASKGIYTLEILTPGNNKTAISIMNQ